jgi:N utilization substance protein A
MYQQFMAAVRQLGNEKGLSEEVVLDIVKAAIRTAYRKDYGTREQNVDVDIDPTTEMVSVFEVKTVVDQIEDEENEITLAEAKKFNKSIKSGEVIRTDVTPEGYGRIAAQAAKQVILQRIQEAERDQMYELFKDRENELINALIHRVDNNQIFVELGGVTALLPHREQIPTENYYGGQRIKLYLDRVIKTPKGPQLLISRTHPKLIEKLLELEIPEIKAGVIVIKGVAREPGVRCKVAVHSTDPQVDPIGACVGQKGVRVQSVTQELSGERIDVIPWNADARQFIMESLKPAKIARVELDEVAHLAKVYVTQDQRALAIGKSGQNVRLASHLTGWEIDVLDTDGSMETNSMESAPRGKSRKAGPSAGAEVAVQAAPPAIQMIQDLALPEEVKEKLGAAGLEQVEQLRGLTAKDFTHVEGITQEEAQSIVEAVKK